MVRGHRADPRALDRSPARPRGGDARSADGERADPARTVRSTSAARGRGELRHRSRDSRGTPPPARRRSSARGGRGVPALPSPCWSCGAEGDLGLARVPRPARERSSAEGRQHRPASRRARRRPRGARARRARRGRSWTCSSCRSSRELGLDAGGAARRGRRARTLDLGPGARARVAVGRRVERRSAAPPAGRRRRPDGSRAGDGGSAPTASTLRLMDVSRAYAQRDDRLRSRSHRGRRPGPARPSAAVRRHDRGLRSSTLEALVRDTEQHRSGGRPIAADRRRRCADAPGQRFRARIATARRGRSRRRSPTRSRSSTGSCSCSSPKRAAWCRSGIRSTARATPSNRSGRSPKGGASRPGLWQALQAIARLAHRGCTAGTLRVVPFNGRLFAPSAAPLADSFALDDRVARDVLLAVTTRPAADRRERITYADLGVEQLGAVYERVLDYAPSAASGAVTLMPSGRRKDTGTFYTPRSMTEYLVRRTLAPLVRGRAPEAHPRAARRGSRDGQRRVPGRGVPLSRRRLRRRADRRRHADAGRTSRRRIAPASAASSRSAASTASI